MCIHIIRELLFLLAFLLGCMSVGFRIYLYLEHSIFNEVPFDFIGEVDSYANQHLGASLLSLCIWRFHAGAKQQRFRRTRGIGKITRRIPSSSCPPVGSTCNAWMRATAVWITRARRPGCLRHETFLMGSEYGLPLVRTPCRPPSAGRYGWDQGLGLVRSKHVCRLGTWQKELTSSDLGSR